MSLVGNFYSRITAKKMEQLLCSSPIPTVIELQEAIKDGKQVQGSEILLQLCGLRQRVQGHMQNLVVVDALQEITDILSLVSLGIDLFVILQWINHDSSTYRPTRAILRPNPGLLLPALHGELKFTRSPLRHSGSAVSSSNRSSLPNPSNSWKPLGPNRKNGSGLMPNQEMVPLETSNEASGYSSIQHCRRDHNSPYPRPLSNNKNLPPAQILFLGCNGFQFLMGPDKVGTDENDTIIWLWYHPRREPSVRRNAIGVR